MFTHFTKEENAVHNPIDRRTEVAIKPYMLKIFGVILFGLVAAAWIQ